MAPNETPTKGDTMLKLFVNTLCIGSIIATMLFLYAHMFNQV